ncbi:kinase-like domain-containing protein [Dendryphion nanum]|uniref:mitogen-activated protein kinase n=1 Tax=Dendryphion nanum TaxID=256645 RepID=A0A9P9ICA1_9PLEO|nr:kinase-like domain-containing protein [Dendryphion nanum]
MLSVSTILFSAFVTDLLPLAFAGPVSIQLTSKTSSIRSFPISFDPLGVGDIIVIQDSQILRKNEDDTGNVTVFDPFAFETRYNPRVGKRIQLSRRADAPPAWDEDESYACLGTRVMFDDKSIGSGSSGFIYGATRTDGVRVAMKGVQEVREADAEWSMMQTVGDHPNIIRGFGRCSIEAMHYIMLELLEGGTLAVQINALVYKGNEAVTKAVIAQVFAGILQMHSKGVAHQDIKGENVMFDKTGVVKVIDLGAGTTEKKVDKINVAGGIRSPGTYTKAILYHDPANSSKEAESSSGTKDIDTFSNDTWEVATMLVHMLTGKKPWTDANALSAKAIWTKTTPAQRSSACKSEWPSFTAEFCTVLASVFVDQSSRKDLSWFAGQLANPALKLIDECDDGSKKTAKRAVENSELVVVGVEDAGAEWIVRAKMP